MKQITCLGKKILIINFRDMEKKKLLEWLKDYDIIEVENYIKYLEQLRDEKDKNKETKNKWFWFKSDDDLINYFKKVKNQWLVFDWKHITLQSTWISFDYIALKNKMLLVYPESLIDVQLVYEWDEIEFWKESWKIAYKHILTNPFLRDETKIIWAYCVIKNKRWEFLTTLNSKELEKHRKTAKTDYIWASWFSEMSLKTIIKKAVKIHFDDIYSEIIEIDNEENDLNNPINIELSWKQEIEAIQTIEELKEYYLKNKGKWKEFDIAVNNRKALLINQSKNDNS